MRQQGDIMTLVKLTNPVYYSKYRALRAEDVIEPKKGLILITELMSCTTQAYVTHTLSLCDYLISNIVFNP